MDLLGVKGTCYYHDHGFNREAHHQNQQMCEQFSKAFRNLAKNWAGIRRGHCYLGNRMQMFVFLFCVCVFVLCLYFCFNVCVSVLCLYFCFVFWFTLSEKKTVTLQDGGKSWKCICIVCFCFCESICFAHLDDLCTSYWLFVLIISGSFQHYGNLFCLFVYLGWEGEYDFAV